MAWGRNNHGQCDVPGPNADVVGVSRGFGSQSLGLKAPAQPIPAFGRFGLMVAIILLALVAS